MFHSAECQIRCPITQQIKAKGPPPLPLWLIIEMSQCTSHRKKWVCQKKKRDACSCTHMHAHNTAINTADKEAEGLRVALSNPVCLFRTESLCYARHTHTEASQCWSQTAMENSRSEHYQNVKINQAVLLFLCVDVLWLVLAKVTIFIRFFAWNILF